MRINWFDRQKGIAILLADSANDQITLGSLVRSGRTIKSKKNKHREVVEVTIRLQRSRRTRKRQTTKNET